MFEVTKDNLNQFLKHELKMQEQECEGDYWFDDVQAFCTPGFKNAFKDELLIIMTFALMKINELEHPDYLQVFYYNDIKFYVISDYDKSCTREWIKEQTGIGPYVTFLLPSEY